MKDGRKNSEFRRQESEGNFNKSKGQNSCLPVAFLFRLLTAGFCILFLPSFVHAVWTIQDVDGPKKIENMTTRSMALDKTTNFPHIAYGGDHLYHAFFDGKQWVHETVDGSSGVGSEAAIAVDGKGKVHISYYDSTNGDLKYATNSLGKWQAITLVTGNVGEHTSIALDSNNKVHISYYDRDKGDLKYATNTSGTWKSSTVERTVLFDGYTSIAVDSQNKSHISYSDGSIYTLKYATNASENWVITTLDSSGDVGWETSIVLDSNDKAHISYHYSTNGYLKYATNASGTWKKTAVESESFVGDYSSIAVDIRGKAHISYNDWTEGKVKYATNAGGVWTKYAVDSLADDILDSFNSIVLDNNSKVHINYYDGDHCNVNYATNASGPWVISTVDSAGDVGLDNSIVLDSNNNVHISYYDRGHGDLRYATNASGVWVTTTVDSSGGYTSITLDSSNKAHISYYDYSKGDLKYATNASGTWVLTTVDSAGYVGSDTSIAVDSSDKVHISYYDWSHKCLKYATNVSGTWVMTMVDSVGDVGRFSSIAVDSDSKVHISYYDWVNLDLKYATNASGAWVATRIDNMGDFGGYTSIVVDKGSRVHISYYVYPRGDLRCATDASGKWVITTVDSAGDVGGHTSIALDKGNKEHISYYDWTNGNLKYATNASGAWMKTTVDSSGGVGWYTSIALDSDDKAHISYLDLTNGGLKYATNALVDVTPPIGTVTVNNDVAYTRNSNIELNMTCGDLQGRCTQMKFSNDGLLWTTEEKYSSWKLDWDITSATYGGNSGDGLKTVYALFRDFSGNWSEPASDTIILDTTGPIVTANPAGGSGFGSARSVSLTCSDGEGSGCESIYYTDDGTAPITASDVYTTALSINKNTTLKFMATDNLGNKSAVAKEVYNFIPGVTDLTLDLTSPTIEFGGTITVWGRLQNLTQNGADPTGETITLEITDPLGGKTTKTTTITDPLGFYLVEGITGFTHKGAYTLQAHFAGSGLLAKADSPESVLLVGASAGYAIIVEGKIPIEEGLESHNKTANRIYERLKNRGFIDDNIYYFNYQSQGGVDGKPLKAMIKYAVEEWAAPRMNGMPAPLYIIMVDHGSPKAFHIDNETISPEDLDAWLGTLEAGLNAEARLQKRVIIIGACYSGSFIPVLSQAPTDTDGGRIIIASAAKGEVSYKGPKEDDNIRSGEFFLEEFFIQLERGYTIKEAFETATAGTEIFTQIGGSSPNNNAPYFDGAVQHPLLDDNGDGVGSNLLTAGLFDDGTGTEALVLGVGPDYQTNGADNPAEVTDVTLSKYLSTSKSSALLWAKVNNDDWVDTAVWMEIRPPSMVLDPQGGSGQEEVDIPKVPMVRKSGRWEKDPALADPPVPFTETGKYEIFYFVRDKETKEVSPMKRSVVYKNEAGNIPPSAFSLLSPANGSEQQTVLLLNWGNSTDPDGLTYTLLISRDPNPTMANADYVLEEIPVSMAAIGPEAGLEDYAGMDQDHLPYYWKVIAVDAYGARTSSEVRSFKTNNTNPELKGFIEGIVVDKASGALVASPKIVTSRGLIKVKGSNYEVFGNPGDTTLTVNAAGYAETKVTASIKSGKTVYVNIALTDNAAPETTITSKPANPTTSKSATFSFKSSEAGSKFKCKLDGSVYTACTSPKTYSGLTAGSHTFRIKAIDATGNMDATPAIYRWTVQ